MRRFLRALPLLLVAPTLAAGPAVAQDEPPPAPEVVAQVGAEEISKAEFDDWLATHPSGRPVKMAPPRYERCVAARRAKRAAKGWRKLGVHALRKRCRRQHRALWRRHRAARREVLTLLVQARWIEQEAQSQGIELSEERLDQAFRKYKRRAFGTERAYRRFLHSFGITESSAKYAFRLDLLGKAIKRRVTSEIAPVTKRDVARFRARHRGRFAGMRRARANRKIRAEIVSRREQRVLARFVADFRARYAAITWCAPGHRIDECGAPTPA